MKKIIFSILLLIVYLFSNAQINKFGTPEVKYYSSKEFKAEAQNWAAVQDSRDVMYFGNNIGILKFDGTNWDLYKVENKSIVRSLAVDSNNIIYAGAVSEFGCLLPTKQGDLKYYSLSEQLDSTVIYNDIWKTYVINNNVYFCSWEYIFVFENLTLKKTIPLPEQSFHAFAVNSTIYVSNIEKGLLSLNKKNSLHVVKGGEQFKETSIYSIIPIKNSGKLLISSNTPKNNSVYYDAPTGKIIPFLNKETLSLIRRGYLYDVIQLDNGYFAFATLHAGVLITDSKGKIIYLLNKSNILPDNIVISLFQSEDGPLWLTLNEGIARIDINFEALNYYNWSTEIGGTSNGIFVYNDILYIASDDGVSFINNNSEYPVAIKTKIENQTWDFERFKTDEIDVLLVGTNNGLFELLDTSTINEIEPKIDFTNNIHEKKVKGKKFRARNLHKLKNRPIILICAPQSVRSLEYKDGKWTNFTINRIETSISEIIEDNDGNIWLISQYNGIYKARFTDSLEIIDHFNEHNGFKSLKSICATIFNDTVYFGTQNGIFWIDEKTKKATPKRINGINHNEAISNLKKLSNGNYIISIAKEVEENTYQEYFLYDKVNNTIDSFSINILPRKLVASSFYEYAYNKLYLAQGDKFYTLDLNKESKYLKPPKVIFSEIKIKATDSVIFNGIFTKENTNPDVKVSGIIMALEINGGNVLLQYKFNEINFRFTTPYYKHQESIEYSYFMEGDDKEWSKWSKENYDNEKLDEGDYTLKVKARNIYGVESEISEFKFSIDAPWYRTLIAYIIYGILIISFIILIVYLNNRRLLKDKARLEKTVKERTAEVVQQKEEIEVQKEKIEIIHEEITDSIHYAERIQRAILPTEEHVNKAVPEHFILFKPKDIVSGDYYWATVLENENKNQKDLIGKLVITAADCTGHGVPGAFMSMLGVSFLNEIVNAKGVDQSHQILNLMRENVISSLQQKGEMGEQKDGMDMAIMVIDIENNKVQFSGANNPLYVIRKKSQPELKVLTPDTEIRINDDDEENILYEIKGDKMPISIHILMDDFRLNEFEVMSGDTLYMFSDGYADQFGGKKGKKFKYKPFKRLFLNNQHKSMKEQKDLLDKAVEDWKAFTNPIDNEAYEQVDDIVVIGVKIP